MPTINYFIQTSKNPAGIYIRLREGSIIDCKAKTNYAINPANWDTGIRKVKGKLTKIKDQGLSAAFLKDVTGKKLNGDLETLKSDLLTHFNNSNGKEKINSRWLKDFINPPPKKESVPESLVKYFDYYIEHNSNIKQASINKLQTVKRLIELFERETKCRYLIKDVGDDFILKFKKYCVKKNYEPNTTARYIKFIKTICYNAREKRIETHYELNSIKVKILPVDKIYLNFDELKKIENAKIDLEHLDNARDWLLIGCEVAQRVSDLLRFNKNMIKKYGKKNIIEFTQIKTGKVMGVPLSSKVMAILKKRNGDFPYKTSDETFNQNIKQVCKIAGLKQKIKGRKRDENGRMQTGMFEKWELCSSHICRRSMLTNYHGNIPTSVLKYLSGHKTEDMLNAYLGKTNSESALHAAEFIK